MKSKKSVLFLLFFMVSSTNLLSIKIGAKLFELKKSSGRLVEYFQGLYQKNTPVTFEKPAHREEVIQRSKEIAPTPRHKENFEDWLQGESKGVQDFKEPPPPVGAPPVISGEVDSLETAKKQKNDAGTIEALKKLRQKLIKMGGQENLLGKLDGVEKAFKEKDEDRWKLLDRFWNALLKKLVEGEKEEEEEEEEEIPAVVLKPQEPLATVDIEGLSEADKKNSDAAFVGALKTISQEFFIWFDGWDEQDFHSKIKDYIRDKKLALPEKFDSLFHAYRYFVRNRLVVIGTGTRIRPPKFKKVEALKALVGLPSVQVTQEYKEDKGDDFLAAVQEKIGDGSWLYIEAHSKEIEQEFFANLDTLVVTVGEAVQKAQKKKAIEISLRVFPGTLGAFVYEKMYRGDKEDEAFLTPLYEMFQRGLDRNEIVRGLVALFEPCVFDAAVLRSDEATRAIEGMAINIIASQRALVKIKDKGWEPVGLSRLQEEGSDLEVQGVFEKLMNEIGDKELNEEGLLDKDYGQQLYVDLNRLRINPDFYRFAGMFGSQAERKNDEQDPGRFFALFSLLFYDKDPALIDFTPVNKNVTKQLLFSKDSLQDLIGTWGQPKAPFKKLVDDRRNRALLTADVDAYTFLNAKIRPDSSYKQLRSAVIELQKRMRDKRLARDVLDSLKEEPPDLEKIVKAFKALTGKDVASFNNKVTTIVQERLKKLQIPNAVIEMITKAKAEFDRTKAYVDSALKNAFEAAFSDHKLIKREVYERYHQNLFGFVRTPATVAQSFTSLVGNLPKVAKLITGKKEVAEMGEARKILVNWVAPYGLLNQVFLSIKEEGKSSEDALRVIVIALTALNKAELPVGQPREDLPLAVKNDAGTIALGGYKGKLGTMITHVTDDYNVEAIMGDIHNFVTAANIKLEEAITYQREIVVGIRAYLITIMAKRILEVLQALNSKESHYDIPNLSIETEKEKIVDKRRRNIKIYRGIQDSNILKPLIALLSPGDVVDKLEQLDLGQLDQTTVSVLEGIKKIEAVDDEAYGVIELFIKDFAKKLKRLKEATTALSEAQKALKEAQEKAPKAPHVPEGFPEPPPLPEGIPAPPPPPPVKVK